MMGVDDIGSYWWNKMYERTKNDCFNVEVWPPFPESTRTIAYNSDIYVLPIDACFQNCNERGLCTNGRCTCNNGWHGEACEFKNCFNSLVYVDIDTINP